METAISPRKTKRKRRKKNNLRRLLAYAWHFTRFPGNTCPEEQRLARPCIRHFAIRFLGSRSLKKFLVVFAAASLLFAALPGSLAAGPQEPSSSQQAPPAAPKQKRYKHANDFLMRGTVFNEKALALPGAELRIRRISEKKFRWETMTNSRGEFAVRVPQGADYELVLHAKGFAEQKKTVDARSGGNEERMVFRMELAAEGKSKGKK